MPRQHVGIGPRIPVDHWVERISSAVGRASLPGPRPLNIPSTTRVGASGALNLKFIELDSSIEQVCMKRQSKTENICDCWYKLNEIEFRHVTTI